MWKCLRYWRRDRAHIVGKRDNNKLFDFPLSLSLSHTHRHILSLSLSTTDSSPCNTSQNLHIFCNHSSIYFSLFSLEVMQFCLSLVWYSQASTISHFTGQYDPIWVQDCAVFSFSIFILPLFILHHSILQCTRNPLDFWKGRTRHLLLYSTMQTAAEL
jgi:hypothetical protein